MWNNLQLIQIGQEFLFKPQHCCKNYVHRIQISYRLSSDIWLPVCCVLDHLYHIYGSCGVSYSTLFLLLLQCYLVIQTEIFHQISCAAGPLFTVATVPIRA